MIVKHANPCGVAPRAPRSRRRTARPTTATATSAFGGIVALNRPLDAATARAIAEIFTEVVIAPDVDAEARRGLRAEEEPAAAASAAACPTRARRGQVWRQVAGGFLVQDRDAGHVAAADLRVVTRRAPTQAEIADLLFAWRVAKHVKSNAIVYARGGATVGIGAGQMSRVDSTRIAASQGARHGGGARPRPSRPPSGSVVASDAFFPFADGLIAAAEAGAIAVIQPGGSMRDDEVIAAADAAGLAMVFTGMRHFRH